MFECCIDCKKRHLACHDTCAEYAEYKVKCDMVRKQRRRNYAAIMRYANSNSKIGRNKW